MVIISYSAFLPISRMGGHYSVHQPPSPRSTLNLVWTNIKTKDIRQVCQKGVKINHVVTPQN